jgi:hypothetical protein
VEIKEPFELDGAIKQKHGGCSSGQQNENRPVVAYRGCAPEFWKAPLHSHNSRSTQRSKPRSAHAAIRCVQ